MLYLLFEFIVIYNIRLVVWNANLVKFKKSELASFLSINSLDFAAISATLISHTTILDVR